MATLIDTTVSSQEPLLPTRLIEPYCGHIIDLVVNPDDREQIKERALRLRSTKVSVRTACDLELLACGGFSPLDRFMGRADYERCIGEMRLSDGTIFPIPVTLPIADDEKLALDTEIAIRDEHNDLLAVMMVEEIFEWNSRECSIGVIGTQDIHHPLNAELSHWGRRNISGLLKVVSQPRHFDFRDLRLTPTQAREKLGQLGRSSVVAFQTRNPLHRAHEEMVKRAAAQLNASILLHPAVGMTKPGDVEHFSRVRSYKRLFDNHFDPRASVLSLLPLAMRMAGPREALWHMLIRRNYGASHMIVGRDHASPGLDSHGKLIYQPLAAQELAHQYSDEIGVGVVAFDEMVYLPDEGRYEEISKVDANAVTFTLSGTRVREDYLNKGIPLPGWFSRPEVSAVLAETYLPKPAQGLCVWFTGLSGAGKTTIAEILTVLMLERGRRITLLDGDVVRTHLSKGLGFSKEDRDANIRRIGFVASEIVRHRGIAICAAVSPYRSTRGEVRAMFSAGQFIEIFVDTPIEVCEQRDVKGMYAKVRAGEIRGFTGIDDPYEPPESPEVTLHTVGVDPEECALEVLIHLERQGFLSIEIAAT